MFVYSKKVDPDQLEPRFRRDVEAVLAADPARWLITYGRRTLEEQRKLYEIHLAGGPKAAPPGKSAHNWGLAIDVMLDGNPAPGWQPDWDTNHEAWQRLFLTLKKHPRLQSGVRFGDGCHIQRYRWTRFKAAA